GCLRGVAAVQEHVLAKLGAPALRAYFVWLPVLPGDDLAAAKRSATRYLDPRVTHFWDGERKLGLALGHALAIPPRTPVLPPRAWAASPPSVRGVRWKPGPRRPTFWMHKLGGADKLAPLLDGPGLREKVEAALRVAGKGR